MKDRIMVLGLDGGTFDIITPWIQKGRLSTFKRIVNEGVHGKLESVLPPITPVVWSSFLTGKNPGKHGIFDFCTKGKEPFDRKPVNALDISSETFYEVMSRHGMLIGMLNVPMTFPPKEVNGFVVSGMMTPPGRLYTYPEHLQKELDSIDYKIEIDQMYRNWNKTVFLKAIDYVVTKRKEALLHLMNKVGWDFLMCVFRSTDNVSHIFWRHPEIILNCYQRIDGILEELLERLDEKTHLFIVSDHGFGPINKEVLLNNWLLQKGFLKFKKGTGTRTKRFLQKNVLSLNTFMNLLEKSILGRLPLQILENTRGKIAEKAFLSFSNINWERTKAYALGYVGEIYVNAQQEDEYERTRNEIISELSRLRDPETNRKVVERVYKKEEIYHGAEMNKAPDLVIKWRNMEYIHCHLNFPFMEKEIFIDPPDYYTAAHKIHGIFMAKGPHIREGQEIKDAQIIDLAPIFLHIMGIPIPRDMDGKVIMKIFKDGSEPSSRKVKFQEPMEMRKEKFQLAEEDMKQIEERLKKLGYI